ncbi:TPA: hypothetical protein MA426_002950 [Klebsiella pneumoniae]|nr:hypothetical protein [Klebsiella pneumoniae]HBT3859165.1 hypothetical protein [Klebsiella pneumoniae]HBW4349310.1 hypothetical protein [Klebsiella pneumoniae]
MIGVFPAPAGINRFFDEDGNELEGVPRASGDKPVSASFTCSADKCSPRQRG